MKIILILLFSVLNGQGFLDYLSGPITLKVGLVSGYDDNVLRFSDIEKRQASENKLIMDGTDTFDSHFSRLYLVGEKKIQLIGRGKYIYFYSRTNFSNYSNNKNRQHWSGNFKTSYKWGSYRKASYSIRHLNSYYIRHYIDRDISNNLLRSCSFSDREQLLEVTHPIKRRLWATMQLSYTQRYFDKPFTEFDLDILYSSFKISRKLTDAVTIATAFKYGDANNITYGKTAKASVLDRSYKNFEWYMPFTYNKDFGIFNKVGFSIRQDFRSYVAEAVGDPLHNGRNHIDSKINFWGEYRFNEKILVKTSLRYRNRKTESQFDWVSELKTFHQWQAWVSIEWKMLYDRY
tara:strand:- start:264 stop:1304 length:1041 start_codon:yes stop_codon:yes gene_type:complete